MQPDFKIVQGETIPVWEDTLTYSNGTVAEPESVELVLRAPTSSKPVTLTGTASVVSKAKGEVSFAPAAADTEVPGSYLASWKAQINKKPMTFPTDGWLLVEIQPNLTKGVGQLIGLPEVLNHLRVPANDRTHDDELLEYIEAVGPLIENLTGPIIPATYDEWYEGGHSTISLRHKPSYGYGTNPVLNVLAVSEYRGPIEYNLAVVGTPTQGSVYSVMVHPELGTIVRRTAGGGTYNFWSDPSHPQQSVHVVYQAGQESTPSNVRQAAIETIRWWYDSTMAVGRGSLTQADQEMAGRPLVALPYHAIAMLEPTRRHPALA